MQSAKSIKDIQHNLSEFRQNANEITEKTLVEISKNYFPLQVRLLNIENLQAKQEVASEISEILLENEAAYH